MNKYEAMFIVKPDLSEEDKKTLLSQIAEAITKNSGTVASASVWQEKRKLTFPIRHFQEGVYYLANFSIPADAIGKIKYAYKLNDMILRVMITRL